MSSPAHTVGLRTGLRIVAHCPELTLKGENRKAFQKALEDNIDNRLGVAGLRRGTGLSKGRLVLTGHDDGKAVAATVAILRQIPGVSFITVCRWLHINDCLKRRDTPAWDRIAEPLVALARETYRPDASFAIKVNRTHKGFPASSGQAAASLGDALRTHTLWSQVNLSAPDQVFFLDIHPDGPYFYKEKIPGIGGLPFKTGGKVLALLSGGIDSPVAAFQLARRGCRVDFFHLSAGHLPPRRLPETPVARLARQLSRYTQRSRLFVAPYTYFDLALRGRQTGHELVLFRRFLLRMAERLAEKLYMGALVNGDSLGQVASQTLENIVSSARAVRIPVFRPLIGANKEEIIAAARALGTYDISIEPYKDCCALLAGGQRTRTRPAQLAGLEAKRLPDYEGLLQDSFRDMVCLEYKYGELLKVGPFLL